MSGLKEGREEMKKKANSEPGAAEVFKRRIYTMPLWYHRVCYIAYTFCHSNIYICALSFLCGDQVFDLIHMCIPI